MGGPRNSTVGVELECVPSIFIAGGRRRTDIKENFYITTLEFNLAYIFRKKKRVVEFCGLGNAGNAVIVLHGLDRFPASGLLCSFWHWFEVTLEILGFRSKTHFFIIHSPLVLSKIAFSRYPFVNFMYSIQFCWGSYQIWFNITFVEVLIEILIAVSHSLIKVYEPKCWIVIIHLIIHSI